MPFSPKSMTISLFAAAIVMGGAMSLVQFNNTKKVSLTAPAPVASLSKVSIASDDSNTVPQPQLSEVHSPDGRMKINMTKTFQQNGATYAFSVANIDGSNPTQIFTKTLTNVASMSLPLNSFSPNNNYVFIKEDNSGSVEFYVFRSDGEAFASGQSLSVVSLFNAKSTGFKLSDVTGWDSNTLLHVFTKTESGIVGPSFWFEVPSGGFIKLADR